MKAKKIVQDSSKAVKVSVKATGKYLKEYPKAFVSKTPKWQRKFRNIGIILGIIGTGIVTAPVSFPAAVVTAGGYLIWGGGVITAICQGFKESK